MHRLRVYFNRNTKNGKYTFFFFVNIFYYENIKERKRELLVYNMLEKKMMNMIF
jgi:hypothetical protein